MRDVSAVALCRPLLTIDVLAQQNRKGALCRHLKGLVFDRLRRPLSETPWSAVLSSADACYRARLGTRAGNNRSRRASCRAALSNTDDCTEGGPPQCDERPRLRGARGEKNILLH